MITIYIVHPDGTRDDLELPTGLNMSLMEVLRANGYPILATCGGIALCATCAIEVLSGGGHLLPAMDQELDMLDILPDSNEATRLACQIRLSPALDGMVIRLAGND
ncbi:MAG: 2Fe-2S iron-sulfur cluster-binding protein [Mucilaginibacter sp.]